MINLSKPFSLKLLPCAIFAIFALCAPALAEQEEAKDESPSTLLNQIKESTNNSGKSMKSMQWKTPESENEAEKERKSDTTASENTEDNSSDQEDATEEEKLTEDQKLWRKYKDLAAGKGEKDPNEIVSDGATEGQDEEVSEDMTTESEGEEEQAQKQEKEKSPAGMSGIIDEYRNAQKKKGKMNSRSFGNIDR